MGKNKFGFWDDDAVEKVQRRLDIANKKISRKYEKKHNDLMAKLNALDKNERIERDAAKQKYDAEIDALVTLWDKP